MDYQCEAGGHINKIAASVDATYNYWEERWFGRDRWVEKQRNDREFSYGCQYSHANANCQWLVHNTIHENRRTTYHSAAIGGQIFF